MIGADGTQLGIKALPGSRRNGITGVHDGLLKVAVTQVAEKGKANAANEAKSRFLSFISHEML